MSEERIQRNIKAAGDALAVLLRQQWEAEERWLANLEKVRKCLREGGEVVFENATAETLLVLAMRVDDPLEREGYKVSTDIKYKRGDDGSVLFPFQMTCTLKATKEEAQP